MDNPSFDFTPKNSSAGGTLLYIADHLSLKSCPDLDIHNNTKGTCYQPFWNKANKSIIKTMSKI